MRKKTPAQLKKSLWKVFSEYIRKRDKGICFICGRKCEGSGYHAAHFIPKSVGGLALYFHEDNVHGCCYHDNINLGGNLWEYGNKLGIDRVNELYALKQKIVKDYPFERKIEEYKAKIKDLSELSTL